MAKPLVPDELWTIVEPLLPPQGHITCNLASFDNNVADDPRLAAERCHAATALESAVLHPHLLDGRAILVLHGKGPLEPFRATQSSVTEK